MTTPTLPWCPSRGSSSGPGPADHRAATPELGRRALRREQLVTMNAPPRRYALAARVLFVTSSGTC